MREIRLYGSEGGGAVRSPYPEAVKRLNCADPDPSRLRIHSQNARGAPQVIDFQFFHSPLSREHSLQIPARVAFRHSGNFFGRSERHH